MPEEERALPAPETTTETAPSLVTGEGEKKLLIYGILALVIILVLIIGGIVLMAQHPEATVVVRDIAIVFVAVMTFFIGIAMLVLLIQLVILIRVLREEIAPLMEALQETLATVRGTTAFVSESVVTPVVKVAGFAAAVRRVTRDLVGVVGAVKHRQSNPSTGGKSNV